MYCQRTTVLAGGAARVMNVSSLYVRPTISPQNRAESHQNACRDKALETEERGRGETVSTMDESDSTTDDSGSADPSCTIMHFVRFF